MISIFEGQPPQNKAFSYQNKGHQRVLGINKDLDSTWNSKHPFSSLVGYQLDDGSYFAHPSISRFLARP